MSGRSHKSPQQRAELAKAVDDARRGGVPWKVLERLYGRGRKQLCRYAADAQGSEAQGSDGRNDPSFSHYETNDPS